MYQPIQNQKGKAMTAKPKTTATLSTTAEAFVAALKLSLKPEKKSSIPVLSQVKLDNGTITATDLDLTSIVPFESTGTGSFLVPYHQALNVLSGETGPLSIEFKAADENTNAKVTFRLTECEYKFDSMSLANFPQIPEFPSKPAITIDGAAFRTLLDRTMFAISREESRYTLNGGLLKTANGKLVMVATDGHRLSIAESEHKGKLADTLIRRDTLDYLRSRVNGSISIATDETHQFFETNGIKVSACKLTGNYPNYEAVLPRDYKIHATIASPSKLLPVLTRVSRCADERSKAVKLAWSKLLVLSAESIDNGSARATFDCATNGDVTVGINSTFLSEFLKIAGEESVKVELKDGQSALQFSMDNFRYVLMPMRC
jgi:DNA polymerase III subunit beta